MKMHVFFSRKKWRSKRLTMRNWKVWAFSQSGRTKPNLEGPRHPKPPFFHLDLTSLQIREKWTIKPQEVIFSLFYHFLFDLDKNPTYFLSLFFWGHPHVFIHHSTCKFKSLNLNIFYVHSQKLSNLFTN